MEFRPESFRFFKEGPTGREIEHERWLEPERARAARHRVSAIEQRHRRDHEPAIVEALDMNHGGKIVRTFQFDLEAGMERLFHQRNHGCARPDKHAPSDSSPLSTECGERHHAGGENVARPELARFHDGVTPDHIRHETAHLPDSCGCNCASIRRSPSPSSAEPIAM